MKRTFPKLALSASRMPAIAEWRDFAALGGLVESASRLEVADYADRILKGATPADLAIEQPREFEMAVNQKTAETLGLVLPAQFLVQATEVIRCERRQRPVRGQQKVPAAN
jgi:putative tryptophan/tyrosine transport system substrate-binding protein